MTMTMTFRGTNRVANKLRRAASEFPKTTDRVVGAWARNERGELKGTAYPPERPNQTYVRTGNLANSWSASQIKMGVWKVGNSATYAKYVIGDSKGEGQAWMHVGRWWTARAESEKRTPKLVADLTAALKRELF